MAVAPLPVLVASATPPSPAAPSPPRRGAEGGSCCLSPVWERGGSGGGCFPPGVVAAAAPPPRHRVDGGSYSPFPAWRWRLWRLLPSPGVVVAAARCPLLPGCPSSPRCGADGASLLHRDGLIWEYFEDFVIWDVDSVTTVMRIKFLAIKFMSSRLNLAFSYCFWLYR